MTAFQSGFETACPLYEESLAIARKIGGKIIIASTLEGLASVVAAEGEPGWAARLWSAAEALREAIGAPISPVYRVDYERMVAAVRTVLGKEAFATAWAEGRTTPLEQSVTNALKMGAEVGT